MPELVRGLAVMCGTAMAVVGRLMDSSDDRRDQTQRPELNRLWRQSQGRER